MIAPLCLLIVMPTSFIRLVLITIISILSVTFFMYTICLNNEERALAKSVTKKMAMKVFGRIDRKENDDEEQ